MYEKRPIGIQHKYFLYKFCALVFLRAQERGYTFKLGSKVKGFGEFNDVFVEYCLDDNSRVKHIFVQLKSKTTKDVTKPYRITMKQMLKGKGDFNLRTYYKSYIQIQERFDSIEGVKLEVCTDESLFIIYTNADVEGKLKSDRDTDIGGAEFLMTGGSVLQFNEEKHPIIYQHLQELPRHREFLSRFRIFYRQANEEEMEWHIKRELQQYLRELRVLDSELEVAYMYFRDFVTDWCQNSDWFLKDNNPSDKDPLQKTSEKLINLRNNIILDWTSSLSNTNSPQ